MKALKAGCYHTALNGKGASTHRAGPLCFPPWWLWSEPRTRSRASPQDAMTDSPSSLHRLLPKLPPSRGGRVSALVQRRQSFLPDPGRFMRHDEWVCLRWGEEMVME